MKSAFTLASKKHLFLGFPHGGKKHASIWKFNLHDGHCTGRYYYRDYSAASFCIDQNGEYVWKVSATDTEKIQRYLFNKPSFSAPEKPPGIQHALLTLKQKYKTYICGESANQGSDHLLVMAGGLLSSISNIASKICLPKRSRHAKTNNFSPLCIEISKEMLNSLIDLILYCLSLKKVKSMLICQ